MFEMIGLFVVQVFLVVLGSVAGAICVAFVSFYTRRVPVSRLKRVAMRTAFLFPLLAVFYIEAGLFLHDMVRYVSGKDSILDGMLHYPLANGYRLAFFEETAPDGWVELPGGGRLPIGGIYGVQVARDYVYIHAAADQPPLNQTPSVTVTHGDLPQAASSKPDDRYLEINTATSEVVDHATIEDLRIAAAKRGTSLKFLSQDDAYRIARSAASAGWVFLGILFAPLLAGGVWLLRRLRELRHPPIE